MPLSSKNRHRQTCVDLTIWGCRSWGKKEAQRWLRQLRTAVFRQLSLMPRGFPIAPEDDEFSEEIRQVIVGRYRVLFTIKKRKVHVLHVRGAHIKGD